MTGGVYRYIIQYNSVCGVAEYDQSPSIPKGLVLCIIAVTHTSRQSKPNVGYINMTKMTKTCFCLFFRDKRSNSLVCMLHISGKQR
jgi:hypothetical protein